MRRLRISSKFSGDRLAGVDIIEARIPIGRVNADGYNKPDLTKSSGMESPS
jgi:hypothetical protein